MSPVMGNRGGTRLAYVRYPVISPYRLVTALFRDRSQPVDFIHYAFAQFIWRKREAKHYLLLILTFLFWPLAFAGASAHFTWRCGPKVRRLSGKGILRQVAEQLYCAVVHSVSPAKYYIFDLYKDERLVKAGELIIRYEFKGGIHSLMQAWTARQGPSTKQTLNNKVDFAIRCQKHGVAAIGVVCSVEEGGRLVWIDHPGPALPERDLFLKPTKGKGGRGCERWDFVGNGRYRDISGKEMSAAELLAHVMELGRDKLYMVQPRAVNHPDLSGLCGAALSSMRIMSVMNDHGEPEVLFAVFKISGRGDSVVDNFHAGGFVCKVDMETGELGAATDWGIKEPGRWITTHPITGAPVKGARLPLWRETVDLVRRAHLAFADRPAVGWDVAITDQGPMIVEGNGQFGLDMVQRTHASPAGNSRFCALYCWHIAKALRDMYGLDAAPPALAPPSPQPASAAA